MGKIGEQVVYNIPTIPGKVFFTAYFADHSRIPNFIWDQDTADRYKFIKVVEHDYGGGHTVQKGVYECDKLGDFKNE